MKRNALVAFGLLVLLVPASTILGKNISQVSNVSIVKENKVTIEQARKTALKKVDGTVEDEYTIEDDDEKVTAYVFIIKAKTGKIFEVQIDANNGNVLSSDEQMEDSDSEDPEVVETDEDTTTTYENTTEETIEEPEVETPPFRLM